MSAGFHSAWASILVVVAITAALILREVRQTGRAGAALALATQRREQARQRLQLAEQELARAERERGAHPAGASPAAGAPAALTPAATTAGAKGDVAKSADGSTQLGLRDGKIRPEVAEATDPVLRALSLQVFDAQFAGIWGPVLQQLALPEEKAAALKALLRAHAERRMDVTAVAGEQGLELSDPAIQKMRSADGTRLAQEVLALLGPDDATIFQQFRREMGVMAQISGIAEATYQTGTPLTYAESQQLRSILAANSERMANGFVRPNSVNGEAALAQIAGSGAFSVATVAAFRHQVADEQMHRQISQRLDEIRATITGPVPGNLWMPNVPALSPKPWTRSATSPKAH